MRKAVAMFALLIMNTARQAICVSVSVILLFFFRGGGVGELSYHELNTSFVVLR